MADQLLPITNGQLIDRASIPCLGLDAFGACLAEFVEQDGYLVQFFAYQEHEQTRLLAVVRTDQLFVTSCPVLPVYPSLTAWVSEKFHMFEREIAEQYGILPSNHPWLKMVRYHPNWTGRPDVFGNDYCQEIPGNYPYFAVEGEAVHEVAVGPVHAGIIEPGHFRFQCAGEEVLHLEIQLGYQHRGIEAMLPQLPQKRWPVICEAVAGDTAIGHNLCCCQALETLAGREPDHGARVVRTIALELERIANHLGDLGALSGDVAFNPPAAYFGRMRGDFLNLLQCLCGNRFGKGLIRPGGLAYPMQEEQRRIITEKLDEISPQIEHVCHLLFNAHTVQARFEQTGTVSLEIASKLGLVGYAGRACGLPYDARVAFPTECYASLPPCPHSMTNGDVFSRAMVRREEISHSLLLIRSLLGESTATTPVSPAQTLLLRPNALVVTINEGWRGETSHCLLTDSTGNLLRYKIKDPSFHNWTGLAMSLRNQGISDFPLCNKSYNLSYCGFDL